jgi:hypothetical protein
MINRGGYVMQIVKFYGYFAACYGSLWILLILAAFVTQSHIDLGALGFYGFPLLSAIYATLRIKKNPGLEGLITSIGETFDNMLSKKS